MKRNALLQRDRTNEIPLRCSTCRSSRRMRARRSRQRSVPLGAGREDPTRLGLTIPLWRIARNILAFASLMFSGGLPSEVLKNLLKNRKISGGGLVVRSRTVSARLPAAYRGKSLILVPG